MHGELSLAEISPAVRHDSLKHLFPEMHPRRCRGGPISVSSVIAPPESLLDARSAFREMRCQHGALKFISGSLPEDRGVEEGKSLK